MNFNGTLIKLNGRDFNLDWISYETYQITPNQRMDLNSTRDTTGVLHRTVLKHTATKVEFQTPPMDGKTMQEMMDFIRSSWNNTRERNVTLQYYDMETDTYKTGKFYMPDIQFTIRNIDSENRKINYNAARIAFIEY